MRRARCTADYTCLLAWVLSLLYILTRLFVLTLLCVVALLYIWALLSRLAQLSILTLLGMLILPLGLSLGGVRLWLRPRWSARIKRRRIVGRRTWRWCVRWGLRGEVIALSRVARVRGRVVGLLERRLLGAICARCLRWRGMRRLLGVRPLLLLRLGTV
jgi:hypothetical protein